MKLVSKHLLESLLSLIWVHTKKVELLDNIVILCLIFWGTAMLFSTVEIPFYRPYNNEWKFQFLHIFSNTYYLVFCLIITILIVIKWYLIIVLTCIFLMISDIEHLFMFILIILVYSSNKSLFNSLFIFRNLIACVLLLLSCKSTLWDFLGVGRLRDIGLIPGSGEGHGNPLQYPCLENPMDRGASRLLSMRSQKVGHDWSNLTCHDMAQEFFA